MARQSLVEDSCLMRNKKWVACLGLFVIRYLPYFLLGTWGDPYVLLGTKYVLFETYYLCFWTLFDPKHGMPNNK